MRPLPRFWVTRWADVQLVARSCSTLTSTGASMCGVGSGTPLHTEVLATTTASKKTIPLLNRVATDARPVGLSSYPGNLACQSLVVCQHPSSAFDFLAQWEEGNTLSARSTRRRPKDWALGNQDIDPEGLVE